MQRLSGSLIGEIVPPYNVFTKEVKLRFAQSGGKQAIQTFEGLEKDTLLAEHWDGFEWVPVGEFDVSGESISKGEELQSVGSSGRVRCARVAGPGGPARATGKRRSCVLQIA